MTVNAGRTAYLPADRGGRQHQKIMQLLAAVDADASTPLVETLIASRRPAAAGDDRGHHHRVAGPVVGPPAGRAAGARRRLRRRDPRRRRPTPRPTRRAGRRGPATPSRSTPSRGRDAKRARALRHALAEYELRAYTVTPGPAARGGPRRMTHDDSPGRPRLDGSPPAPGRGLADASASSSCMCLIARPGRSTTPGSSSGRDELHRLPAVGRGRRRRSSGSSARRSAGVAGRRTSIGALFARADRAAARRLGRCVPDGRTPRCCSGATADAGGRARVDDLVVLRPARPRAESATTCSSSGSVVWALVDVRELRRVRSSAAAQRGPAHRRACSSPTWP